MPAHLEQIELADLFAEGVSEEFLPSGEILDLHEKYGPIDFFRCDLDIRKEYFESWRQILYVRKNRRAEVALHVENKNNEILLHTKTFYPPKIYRIPTGGIHPGENVIDALHRELDEETGFSALFFHQPALLVYKFRNHNRSIHFVSYLFNVQVDGEEPHAKDEEENITDYRWIYLDQLRETIEQLKDLKDKWHDWGVMRSMPHEIIYNSLDGAK